MMTLIVVLAAVALVVAAGEAVRVQCRRMLGRPLHVAIADEAAARSDVAPVGAVAA